MLDATRAPWACCCSAGVEATDLSRRPSAASSSEGVNDTGSVAYDNSRDRQVG